MSSWGVIMEERGAPGSPCFTLHNIFNSLAVEIDPHILVNIVTDTAGSGAERSETLGLHSQNRTKHRSSSLETRETTVSSHLATF